MSQLDIIIKEQLGAEYSIDGNPTPVPYRQIPIVMIGVTPTTPAGATLPTGSPVSTIPSPK